LSVFSPIPRRRIEHVQDLHGERMASAGARKESSAAVRRFEDDMSALCTMARILPAVTAGNGASERERLVAVLAQGGMPVPSFEQTRRRVAATTLRALDALKREAEALPGASLYRAKLDELELDLLLLDALGTPRMVRPLSARRFGTGATLAPTANGPVPLARCARIILDRIIAQPEPRVVPAEGASDSLAALVRQLARSLGLQVTVQVEPRLTAGAATGEHTVFIAARCFGRVEAKRLAVHEVLGHLLVAANARAQQLGLLRWGTADAFADQEGLALHMEESFGVMDGSRLRTLAGRVVATDLMHAGASFGEAARRLQRNEDFSPAEAISIAERAYRGGGVARDVAYLLGWLRVHDALANGEASLDELRMGRVSLQALPALRVLAREGYVSGPLVRPAFGNLSRSLRSTISGTTPFRSPPSEATSLIRLELTKE
jgi:uncharacterized protein (TIGR02421 family)